MKQELVDKIMTQFLIFSGLTLLTLFLAWKLTSKKRDLKSTTETKSELVTQTKAIIATLKKRKPVVLEGIDPIKHYLAPHVAKKTWTKLGNYVVQKEKECFENVTRDKWISLRLDGTNFSKTVKAMRSSGVLEPVGFSATFAECMQICCEKLMEKFNGKIGYTQSDEMIILISPQIDANGEVREHTRSGRVTKMTTLAAGFVSTTFVMTLTELCKKKSDSKESFEKHLNKLCDLVPHFDCRMASYDSFEEASALLLWRAYDCGVNGVSDAVHHSKGVEGRKEVMLQGTHAKLQWLDSHSKLPLPKHQANGTYFTRVKRVKEGFNPKKNENVLSLRSVVEKMEGVPVLELAKLDKLIPVDETL